MRSWSQISPESDLFEVEGILDDTRGGDANTEDVLLRGQIIALCYSVYVRQIATKKKINSKFYLIKSCPILLKLSHIFARYLLIQKLSKFEPNWTTFFKYNFRHNFDTFLHRTLHRKLKLYVQKKSNILYFNFNCKYD